MQKDGKEEHKRDRCGHDPAPAGRPVRIELLQHADGKRPCNQEEYEEPRPVDVDVKAEQASRSKRSWQIATPESRPALNPRLAQPGLETRLLNRDVLLKAGQAIRVSLTGRVFTHCEPSKRRSNPGARRTTYTSQLPVSPTPGSAISSPRGPPRPWNLHPLRAIEEAKQSRHAGPTKRYVPIQQPQERAGLAK
jgi:hypothetical protein